MAKWTESDIPDLSGKTVIVTGANSGLGLESTRALASKGARVIMACRAPDKAEAARQQILREVPWGRLELAALDLADLASVRAFAERVLAHEARLDILMNNAGIMAIPYRETRDGFEMQFGTNHLGHFALTARLYPLLAATPGARVVSVSSIVHVVGKMRFHDLGWKRGYSEWGAYSMSKLSNLLFSRELARRAAHKNSGVLSAVAHPGYSNTNLQFVASDMTGNKLVNAFYRVVNPLFAQPPRMGALPQLYAATAPDVKPGEYFGPRGLFGTRGYPTRSWSAPQARDEKAMARLWDSSEELTATRFASLA